MKKLLPWYKFLLFTLLGFFVINIYLYYLSTRIVPFKIPVPLHEQGYNRSFQINTFHRDRYVLALTINYPDGAITEPSRSWERAENELREAYDVDLKIELRDGSGSVQIFHRGGLDDWVLTNSSFGEPVDGGFWKYAFNARIFENYIFDVAVLRSSPAAEHHRPMLLFHGIDDGYFWLVIRAYNALWLIVVVITLAIGIFTGRLRIWNAT